MVSILLLTIDRYETTKRCVDMALANANHPYELLVTDNGSTDPRVIDYIESLNPAVFIKNNVNKGIAPSHNEMLELAKGDYFVLIGNDIELPSSWLEKLVIDHVLLRKAGYRPGMSGIHCVEALWPAEKRGNLTIHPGTNVFGTMFFSREVLDKVGYFNEAYAPYGLDDSEYAYRVRASGFECYYIHAMSSVHVENDWGQDTPYRKMKDESLTKNCALYGEAIADFDRLGNYYLARGGRPGERPLRENPIVRNSGTPIIDENQYYGE